MATKVPMSTKVPMATKVPMSTKVLLATKIPMATKRTNCTKFNPRGLASYVIWACLVLNGITSYVDSAYKKKILGNPRIFFKEYAKLGLAIFVGQVISFDIYFSCKKADAVKYCS
jgi:hypothetical protein